MTPLELSLGVVGVMGLAGSTAVDLLEDEFAGFRLKNLKLFASRGASGRTFPFRGKNLLIQEATLDELAKLDAVLFLSDSDTARQFVPALAKQGVLCIDKSGAFSRESEVPLVIPEVNSDHLEKVLKGYPVIATPGSCVTPLLTVLAPLHRHSELSRVIVSTYQSVSDAGKPAMEILSEESRRFFTSEDLSPQPSNLFPKPIAFNVMPFINKFVENGNTDDELDFIHEVKKVLTRPALPVAITAVRVPVFVGHALSVTAEFERSLSLEEVKNFLNAAQGITVIDESKTSVEDEEEDVSLFATPRECQGENTVFVSRIRQVEGFSNGFSFWIVTDNLRKGAALNAIQTLENCCVSGIMGSLVTQRTIV